MTIKTWFKSTAIKAVKTMAETAVGLLGSNVVGITDVDWLGVLSVCLLSGVTTMLIYVKDIPEPNESE